MTDSKASIIARGVVPVFAVFITMVLFNWLYHGHLLMGQYEATASLWRPMAEMESLMWFCMARQLLQSITLTWIFSRNYENRGVPEGVRFGLAIGILLGVMQAGAIVSLPIPTALALGWFAGEVLLGVLTGIVLALTFRRIPNPNAEVR